MKVLEQIFVMSADNTEDAFIQALTELNWSPKSEAAIKTDVLSDLLDVVSYMCKGDFTCTQTHQAVVEVKHNGMFLVMFTILNEHVY